MTEAVLLDLVHGSGSGSLLELEDRHVFLLCGSRSRDGTGSSDAYLSACRSVHVLDSDSLAECVYRLKRTVDQLDLSSVRVLTSPRGRDVLLRYQERLFTAVYTFRYVTWPGGTGPAPSVSPGGGEEEGDICRFLQQLPALRGDISVLTSSLIPACFGHGFSTRAGGVSCIPTLSSLNLFSSSRRRDPVAVVMENRRRLALHAGFHPRPLRLVKVNHASDVWVLGKAEPESYDAMVTNQRGVVLAAPGADCMPILFADPVSKVIGVAHSGWKGTLMGVAMAVVGAMVTEFGCRVEDIVVAVGPSVGPCCFTLEREAALGFHRLQPACVPDPEAAKPHVNIRLANRVLLQRGGVLPEHIHDDTLTEHRSVTPCTSCHPELFFSHVRDGLNFGTQVGFLWLPESQ
ncbi:purine nucleoside phosphorylase LACC1 [Centropristis striata]|uniref:purine nucleoside phosphorylase LACC1 n=1 Tax=Centropristis striata TaxID=184440 RepID=UPI0027DF97D8|nr:purine nucleoside phosphorylase LACC1 [Centropristis striata]XP_059198947.1 purine nucleoside phosphorylase LACC1 [Centropristis striata]